MILGRATPRSTTATELGRGRNLDRQHGTTDMLSPSQLNDLVAFQKTLSTATPVGSGEASLPFGILEIRGGGWTVPKGKKGKPAPSPAGKTTLKLSGFLYGAPSTIDPSQGVTLELGTPGGEEMAIVSRAIALKGGRTLRGKAPLARGKLVVTLSKTGSRWKYTITGQKLDLAPLDLSNGTLTVAFAVGDTTFAKGRVFAQKKNVYKLPKRGRA